MNFSGFTGGKAMDHAFDSLNQ